MRQTRLGCSVSPDAHWKIKVQMAPTLPYELLDIIFDNVRAIALAESSVDAKKDFVKGTRSCLFASRAFRLRALRLLFQHIHIRSRPLYTFKARVTKLCDALDPSDGLDLESAASFVQSVTISFEPEPSEDSLFHFIRPQEVYKAQLQNFLANQNLILLLRRLSGQDCQLKEFEMTVYNRRTSYRPDELKWEDVDDEFRKALFACIHSSDMRYFGVSGIHGLPQSFFHDMALVYLRQVHSVPHQLLPYLGPEQATEMPVPTLEAIFHVQPYETLRSPYHALEELESLSSNADQFHETCEVMVMAKDALVNVWIEHYGEISLPPTLKLDHFQTLRSLSYSHRCIPFFDPDNANRSLEKLRQLIDIHSPMERLENLDIDFYCQSEEIPDPWFKPVISAHWECFDNILIGPMYPSLQTVKLSIFIEVMGELMGDFNPEQFIELHHVQLQRALQGLLTSKRTKLTIDLDLSTEAIAV